MTALPILKKIKFVTNYSVSLSNLIHFHKADSLDEALSLDLQRFSDEVEIFSLDCNHHFGNFIKNETQKKNIQFLNIDELTYTQKNYNSNSLFIMPEINFTVFNINYDRIDKKQFGMPYFVGLKNQIGLSCKNKIQQLGFGQVDEPFALFPHTARYYFESKNIMTWLHQKNCTEPHNSYFEQTFFSSKNKEHVDIDCIATFYKNLRHHEPLHYDHYPMHLFYKKYFNLNIAINLNEQEMYEFNN